MVASALNLQPLLAALEALRSGVRQPPRNDLERDGVIQRFEFTFELSWKTLRKALIVAGRADVAGSPKMILRDAMQDGMIDDLDSWFDFLEARNLIAHTYNAETAQLVFVKAQDFVLYVERLTHRLKQMQQNGHL